MKAFTFTKYGGPEVLKLSEVEKPIPTEDQVLVKVKATSVNPADWRRISADPFLVRTSDGLFKPKHSILGADFAGIVESVGKNVTKFKSGDEVFGDVMGKKYTGGSYAEYVCVTEHLVCLKPQNLTFEQAAAVPLAAVTALQSVQFAGGIKAGQKVVVNGASGGVGTFAVQIAKAYGTEVTGVCSTRNIEMVKSIGADKVIDYTKADFITQSEKYDLILDMAGNRKARDLKNALKPNGQCVFVGFTSMKLLIGNMLNGMLISKLEKNKSGKKLKLMPTAEANAADLEILKNLIEDGKVTPVIQRQFEFIDLPKAIGLGMTKHTSGKIVVKVSS